MKIEPCGQKGSDALVLERRALAGRDDVERPATLVLEPRVEDLVAKAHELPQVMLLNKAHELRPNLRMRREQVRAGRVRVVRERH